MGHRANKLSQIWFSDPGSQYSRAILVAATLPLLLLAGCSAGAKSQTPPPTPEVAVATPQVQTVTDWDSYEGRFQARDSVEVRARVSGYLDRVAFQDGAFVRKGDLLFVIDPRPYQAAVEEAEGRLAQARAQLVYSRSELARARALIATETIAQSVLEQRASAFATAQAAVRSAEGSLARARLDLSFTRVTAPISGRISRHLVSRGNLVNGGDSTATLLTTIVSLDPIEFYFDVDEQNYLKYMRLAREGRRLTSRDAPNPVRITLPDEKSPSRTGAMDFVENRLDESTGTLRGRAIVPNPDHQLNPGQFARVELIGSAPHQAVLIPEAALGQDATTRVVYVLDGRNRVQQRPVTLGSQFGSLREIKTGLRPSDRYLPDGLQGLDLGQVVRPKSIRPRATGAVS